MNYKENRIYEIYKCIKLAGNEKFLKCFNNQKNVFFYKETSGSLNSDKTIYDIDIKGDRAGFFAIYRWIVSALYVADRFGFVPYVSVSDTFYSDDKNENIFENYFVQPFGFAKDDVEESRNVVEFIQYDHLKWLQDDFGDRNDMLCGYRINDDYLNESARIKKKYIRIKDDVKGKLKKDISSLSLGNRCLGIHYRGTDYKGGFKNHPVGLDPEDYFEYIDECLSNGYDKIFVATDDQTGLDKFIEKYGSKIIYYQDVRRSCDGKSVHEFEGTRDNDAYLKGYEVLRDMLTLAECDALVCGKSQVSIAAVIEKKSNDKEFEFYKMIDKGTYTKDTRKEYYRKTK